MTLKTLLLGSAAAFAVVGGAQAADLSVAEPVDSVKVCQTFGVGYWYIPGTDTCLKIGGKVEFDINLHELSETVAGTTDPDADPHSSNYDFVTAIGLNFTASSMTDIGLLEGNLAFAGSYTGDASDSTNVTLDGAYLKIGALKAGHFGSTFNPETSFVDWHVFKSSLKDNNKLELGWAAAGFGLSLGIEDPRETWGSALPEDWSMPLITGKITGSSGAVSGFLSAGIVQLEDDSAWGVDAGVTIGIGSNDKLRLNAAYGDDAFIGSGAGGPGASNDGWSAFASFQHLFSSTLAFDADFQYIDPDSYNGDDTSWRVAGDLVWTPYAGFLAKVRAEYTADVDDSDEDSWNAQIVLKRSW